VKDKHYEPDQKQQMNESASHMKSEAAAPKEQKKDGNNQ
jgi:hypothetical protein